MKKHVLYFSSLVLLLGLGLVFSCGDEFEDALDSLTDAAIDDGTGNFGDRTPELDDSDTDTTDDDTVDTDDPVADPEPVIGDDEDPVNFDPDDDEYVCGDGIKDPNEECDDDNTTSNDGCSSSCESEAIVVTSARQEISVGYNHVCLINTARKSAKCFGENGNGQLGQGTTIDIGTNSGPSVHGTTFIDVGTGYATDLISAGGDDTVASTCVITHLNTLKCFGANSAGQLGKGNTNNLGDGASEMGANLLAIDLGTDRTVKDVSSGTAFHCALLDNNTVKCWGDNTSGQLGQGNTNNLGDGVDEMGDDLTAIDLGTGRTGLNIYSGGASACAILDNDTVKCWGENGLGTLGQESTDDLGDGAGEMGDNLTAIDLGTGRTAAQLAMGAAHVCALLDNDTVKCWGSGASGQLGAGAVADLGDGADEMGDDLAAIDLGTGRTATAITTGANHSCALLDNNTVKCWGDNSAGQLGQGDTDDLGDEANEMGDLLIAIDLGTARTATAIAAGGNNTCAVLDNNTIKCWGANASGQLGRGHVNNLGDGANEMGDNLIAIKTGY